MEWIKGVLSAEAFRGAVIALGVVVAIVSVWTSRSIAKKKQVADMLFASRGDQQLQAGCRLVKSLNEDKTKNLGMLYGDDEHKPMVDQVLYVLNHFESVCVGIKNGIYDEKMVKDAWCTMMMTSYDHSEPLIKAVRKAHGKDTIFQEFEHLVSRWRKAPLIRRLSW